MQVNNKIERTTTKLDILLWVAVVGFVLVGIAANYYFSDIAGSLRLAGWIVLICIVIGIVFQTQKGRLAWGFIKESRIEIRKVVWPTRQETMQTAMVVVGLVVIMALILWGFDSVLLWLVGFAAGQRG